MVCYGNVILLAFGGLVGGFLGLLIGLWFLGCGLLAWLCWRILWAFLRG